MTEPLDIDQTDNVFGEAHAQISVIKDNNITDVEAVDDAAFTSLEDGVVGCGLAGGELYCVYSTTV